MAYYDKDKIKEQLDLDDIFSFVEHLGGEPQKAGETLICRTICHNGAHEGSEKLYYYTNTKLFNCYTGCGSMDIFELLTRVREIDYGEEITFYQAMDYVASFFGLEGVEGDTSLLELEVKEDMDIIKDYKVLLNERESIEVKYDIYDSTVLNNLDRMQPIGWLNEGISPESMELFNIRYYGTEQKIVIPHYNIQGDLIGIRGRALLEEDAKRFGKYMPLTINGKMYNHRLSQNLYGLNWNLKNINAARKIIIFEGEKSVMHYGSMFGQENNIAVATCGSSLSIIQEEIIKKFCDVDEVIIAYDKEFETIGDNDFKRNVAALTRMGERLKNYFQVSVLFDKDKDNPVLRLKDAPVDRGKEAFEELYQTRIML